MSHVVPAWGNIGNKYELTVSGVKFTGIGHCHYIS